MTGEPTSEIQGNSRRRRPLTSDTATSEALEQMHTFAYRAFVLSLGCALLLALSSTFASAAPAKTTATLSVRLTAPEFVASQVGSVKLVYKLPAASKSFSYRLSIKRGGQWLPMRKVTKTGNFKGRKVMSVGKLFVGHKIKVGNYLVDFSCAGVHKLLRFRISPFFGRLTKKSFTISQARSVKLIYGFSKPSKTFTYRLLKQQKGSKWKSLRSVKQTKKARRLYFVGGRTAKLKSIFGKTPFKLGMYRLRISSAYSTRQLAFKIVKSANPATGVGGSGTGGGTGSGSTGDADFTISGGVSGLELGSTAPFTLTLTNPHSTKIFVTRLTVAMAADSTPPGCSRDTNFIITQSNASSSNPITVPAKGNVTLTSAPRAPQITFLNLPTNQDACRNANFALTFSGIAHT